MSLKKLSLGEEVIEISCGAIHTVVMTSSRRLFSCGNGQSYALGHGTVKTQTEFKEISFFSQAKISVKRISCGLSHSGCVTAEGKMYLWGVTGDTTNTKVAKDKIILKVPTQIKVRGSVEQLKLGENFSIALNSRGEVFSWGVNSEG